MYLAGSERCGTFHTGGRRWYRNFLTPSTPNRYTPRHVSCLETRLKWIFRALCRGSVLGAGKHLTPPRTPLADCTPPPLPQQVFVLHLEGGVGAAKWTMIWGSSQLMKLEEQSKRCRGTSLIRKRAHPYNPPQDSRHCPCVGSWAAADSYERGTPITCVSCEQGTPVILCARYPWNASDVAGGAGSAGAALYTLHTTHCTLHTTHCTLHTTRY